MVKAPLQHQPGWFSRTQISFGPCVRRCQQHLGFASGAASQLMQQQQQQRCTGSLRHGGKRMSQGSFNG